jgi:hypothetical protein
MIERSQDVPLNRRSTSSVEDTGEAVGPRRLFCRRCLNNLPNFCQGEGVVDATRQQGGKTEILPSKRAGTRGRSTERICEVVMEGLLFVVVGDMDACRRSELVNEISPSPRVDFDMKKSGVGVPFFEPNLPGLLPPTRSIYCRKAEYPNFQSLSKMEF